MSHEFCILWRHIMTSLQRLTDDIFWQSRHIDTLYATLYGAEHKVRLLADEQEVGSDRRLFYEFQEFVARLFMRSGSQMMTTLRPP